MQFSTYLSFYLLKIKPVIYQELIDLPLDLVTSPVGQADLTVSPFFFFTR